jgi:hypothetical protein
MRPSNVPELADIDAATRQISNAAEEVAPDLVRAEPMLGARRTQANDRIDGEGVVRRDQGRQGRAHDEQQQYQAAEGRGAVDEESPGELRKPRLGFELRGIL